MRRFDVSPTCCARGHADQSLKIKFDDALTASAAAAEHFRGLRAFWAIVLPNTETCAHMTIELVNRNRAMPVDGALLRQVARRATALENPGLSSLEISLVNDAAIARVNEEFLGQVGATDVISFLYASEARGELIISTERAAAQARQWGSTTAREIALYIVHGILHLHGYRDATASQRRRMRRRENELMSQLAREFDLEKILKIKG
jgi:probable rRNA maturation factor